MRVLIVFVFVLVFVGNVFFEFVLLLYVLLLFDCSFECNYFENELWINDLCWYLSMIY